MTGDRVQGWDTIGVTSVGLLTDGRVKREFTGTDGQKRNIFVPLSTLAQEMLTLQHATSAARERGLTSRLTVGDNDRWIRDDEGRECFGGQDRGWR